MSKYYTPDISEFYVGFEFEYFETTKRNGEGIWHKSKDFF